MKIDAATNKAMVKLFCDETERIEATIRKTRPVTDADHPRVARMADDAVYEAFGHRIKDLFPGK